MFLADFDKLKRNYFLLVSFMSSFLDFFNVVFVSFFDSSVIAFSSFLKDNFPFVTNSSISSLVIVSFSINVSLNKLTNFSLSFKILVAFS